jgi:DNA repair protein RecO (recombination protein O)
MIVKTEALVLKSRRYRETSKIVTFYSEKFGKIKGVAKGARETKSRFGAALEPMTHVSIVLYKKEHRDLHMISQSEIVQLFPRLHSDLARITAGLSVVELMDAAMHDEEPSESVFRLVIEIMSELDNATKNLENVLYSFRLRLLDLMGFKPDFQACVRCKKKLTNLTPHSKTIQFDVQAGGIVCRGCAMRFPRRVNLTLGTVKILRELQGAALSDVSKAEIAESSKKEIEEILKTYTKIHLAGVERLRTEGLSKKLVV